MRVSRNVAGLPLESKVAIVTGSGTGIGRAVALAFAEAGADVVVAGRRLDPLDRVAREIRALNRHASVVPTDVSKKGDVDKLVETAIAEFGVIDILVNNAGIISRVPILQTSEDEWDRVMDIDLKGYYLCCQAVGNRMIGQGKGNIVNVASSGGVSTCGGVSISAYGVAKAGVIRLTKGLAWELGRYGIRVNGIAPGYVISEMTRHLWSDPEVLKQAEALRPLGRLAEPDEIASIALFLASGASGNITGETIIADSGFLA